MMSSQTETLSQREREGPAAKRWEGEGLHLRRSGRAPCRPAGHLTTPSPSHAARGPLPLPMGEGFENRS